MGERESQSTVFRGIASGFQALLMSAFNALEDRISSLADQVIGKMIQKAAFLAIGFVAVLWLLIGSTLALSDFMPLSLSFLAHGGLLLTIAFLLMVLNRHAETRHAKSIVPKTVHDTERKKHD